MIELSKTYDFKVHEQDIYKDCCDKGYFKPKPSGKGTYTIVIPPPNITEVLHLGHALNNTIQDVIIRWRRMQGYATLWLPGTDHAGIATQTMVCKDLAKDGTCKEEIGREKFLECLWNWNEKKGGTIIQQLKEIGCSADWERLRFTMDDMLSKAVRETFVRLYEEGLIYKGEYIINWCPSCKTALADEEVEHQDMKGSLWYIKYPFENEDGGITVATTRPETMLGDTAVAVNPNDPRYQGIIGKNLILPIMNRKIPIIADEIVDLEFGTGLVKVTPAHDPNDFEIAKRHDLEFINILNPDGTMNENAGECAGMDRYECREKVIKLLEEKGLLEKIEPHDYTAGHCYRCHTIIEPYLSKQWFVKMKPLAEPAKAVVKRGLVKFYPKRWEGVYQNWLENIHDWCISRQIWWGHQIPVWWCSDCREYIVSRDDIESCPTCGATDIKREEDVLDTWFSSWLWPFSTLGWPDDTKDLEQFYPTDTLVTAAEIIFFWVARMIMAGLHFMGEIPFKDVFIHGTVRDDIGRKMSKSLGNGIDPLVIIEKFGTDALRFTLIVQAAQGQDLFLSEKSFEQGRNFTNKIWNASRLIFSKIDRTYTYQEIQDVTPENLVDKWLLSRLNNVIDTVTDSLEKFRLNDALFGLYHFFWHEFCDWALECYKIPLEQNDTNTQKIVLHVYEKILRMMQPIVPFISDTLWQKLHENFIKGLPTKDLVVAPWVEMNERYTDDESEKYFNLIQNIISALRKERNEWNIPPGKKIGIGFVLHNSAIEEPIRSNFDIIKLLSTSEKIEFFEKRPDDGITCYVDRDIEAYMKLKGSIDIDEERKRLEAEIEKTDFLIDKIEKKLANKNFINKAPDDIVEKEKEKARFTHGKLE
ncbi:MAG: valine--tRNA ligase, partial [Acidobacteria bacterium]|nr:valine--tRNA ligase [Acidobacteriota bacterium]